jgi:uncharacterized protein YdbL (DUF1318 family)
MRRAAFGFALCAACACTPTVNVATEKPIQIAVDVRIRLDQDVKDLLRSEQQGVAPRDLEAPALAREDAALIADAKRTRRVGERADGYLGLPRPRQDAALAQLVERANDSRRRAYQALAARHGVIPRAVEQVAGEQRVADASPGELVMGAGGEWSPQP